MIAETLRQDIVTKRLPDGGRLPSERELSDRFGVGHLTVREALRSLEIVGLIEVEHGRGSFVRSHGNFALASALQTILQLQSVGIMQVIEVRQALGRYSIELAVNAATRKDLASMASHCARLESTDEFREISDVIAPVIGFQRALSAASHNALVQSLEEFLLVLLNEVQLDSLSGRGVAFWKARALDFQPYRMSILDALRSGEASVAREAIDSYFEAQRLRYERDELLREINLSDPQLIDVVANIVQQFRP